MGIRRPETDDNDAIVVFDEAHNLDDFNINSITLTLKEVEGFFSRIDGMKQEQVRDAFIKFVQDPEGGFEYFNLLVQANEELARKFSVVMQAWKEGDKWYVERDTAMWSYIKVMPADPATWLSKLNSYRFILLSGTMPSPDYLRMVWGLSNFEYINALSLWSKTSLKDHFSGAKIYVEDSVYYVRDERVSQRRKVAELIKRYSAKDGLNLVIVPSYNELEAYRSLFPNAFFEDPRPDVLDRVKKLSDGAIVFAVAGGKLSEGIEVLDNEGRSRIKTVFIVGLPLPEYKDPYLDRVIEVVSKRVGRDSNGFKWTVLYEKAVIKVKQAIGRAIRGPNDSANIYLVDKRFGYKNVMRLMNLEVA
jgi:Rad3-related DNA helicase